MTKEMSEEFTNSLFEVMPAVMREFGRRLLSGTYAGKITVPQLFVLEHLFSKGDTIMKDLAKSLSVSTAAMTGIIDRMVREKYVERAFDEKDRRIISIRLTPKGNRVYQSLHKQRNELVVKVFSKIPEESRRQYLKVLLQMRQVFADMDKE